jgi:hypothetical protein
MTAAALFHLGVANYNLARATHSKPQMKEAVAFSEQAERFAAPSRIRRSRMHGA